MSPRFLKIILFVQLFMFAASAVHAQRGGNMAWTHYRHEINLGYGVNSLFSSLGENDKIGFNFLMQRTTMNVSYRYFVFRHFAARASLSHGFARKNDKSENIGERSNARIDYTTTMTEFAALAEYHIFDESTMKKGGRVSRARGGMSRSFFFGLSLFTGVSFGYMRPYGEYFGESVELKPVTDPLTIPNSDRYKRLRMHFPVGAQFRFIISEQFRIGIESGYRLGLNDYINNVSGIYYRDPDFKNPDPAVPDKSFIGYVTFEEDEMPVSSLNSAKGKRHYLFTFVTLAYRFKS